MEKILIVDDSMLSLKILSDILKEDYEVLTTKNGQDTVRMATECSPTIILLDIVMPVMDGFQVLAELKKTPETSSTPVIFITSLNDPENEEKGLILGATDYIYKPFSPRVVKARVKNHIDLFVMKRTIEQLSLIDQLTKTNNRHSFELRMNIEWARAMRDKAVLSAAIVDIDDFKGFNDLYGRSMGDEAVKSVAKKITKSLSRKTDFVGRYGDDEFVILLPETPPDNAKKLLQKVRAGVAQLAIPHERSSVNDTLTASAGGASIIPQSDDIQGFLDMADRALTKAKHEGKNKVIWSDPA